jgi:hypothetical protein
MVAQFPRIVNRLDASCSMSTMVHMTYTPMTAEDVIHLHMTGQKIPWRSCSARILEDVACWADRHDNDLLRKVRAAVRRRDVDDRPAAQGYRRQETTR